MIATLVRLADGQDDEMSRLIDDAGPVAGLFVLLLGVAIFLLWRSMRKQLKRIDPALPAGPNDRQHSLDTELTREALDAGDAAGADESPQP